FSRIDKSWGFDIKTTRPFTLIGIHDLNLDPQAPMPVGEMATKKTGCCGGGQIQAQLKMPKRGFVAGQQMPFILESTNNSCNSINKVKLKLIQSVVFHAGSPGRMHTKYV